MNNNELKAEIDKWHNLISNSPETELYELAFFKIFIKFEKFLSEVFENYSIGNQSDFGYSPQRILCFTDLDHLTKVIKTDNKSFVNHFEAIKKFSECFFVDNPFEIILYDANYQTDLNNMKYIRDYIAHESLSSMNKYIKGPLANKQFISPNEFLKQKKKNSQISNYTHYTNSIDEISKFIIRYSGEN